MLNTTGRVEVMKKRKSGKKEEGMVIQQLDCCEHFHWTMVMHFPDVQPNSIQELSCSRCADFKCGACRGERRFGAEVIECMMGKCEGSMMGFTFFGGSADGSVH